MDGFQIGIYDGDVTMDEYRRGRLESRMIGLSDLAFELVREPMIILVAESDP